MWNYKHKNDKFVRQYLNKAQKIKKKEIEKK